MFIDAPGTGFSRILGKDKAKAFWGVDPDAHAFDRFIRRFLTKYDRWNSPKYLFGESYGTPRSAVLSALLKNVDLTELFYCPQYSASTILQTARSGIPGSIRRTHWRCRLMQLPLSITTNCRRSRLHSSPF